MIRYTFDRYFVYSRRYSSSDNLPQPFYLHPTHGTLNLTPSLLFIHSQTNQRPQPRPKAQYIILAVILSHLFRHQTNSKLHNDTKAKLCQFMIFQQSKRLSCSFFFFLFLFLNLGRGYQRRIFFLFFISYSKQEADLHICMSDIISLIRMTILAILLIDLIIYHTRDCSNYH